VDPDSKRVRVLVSDGTGRAVRDGGLARWLAAIAPPRAAGEVSVALVSDIRMRALNRQYRRQNTSTDVLSFRTDVLPTDSVRMSSAFAEASADRRSLGGGRSRRARAAGAPDVSIVGDIVIATGVARRQAREAGHSYQAELRVLALHGLLHLLGYDHHDSRDNGRMARVEARLRRKGGLASGLIERASERPRTRRTGA
jgi:probable rRNA maturation factor